LMDPVRPKAGGTVKKKAVEKKRKGPGGSGKNARVRRVAGAKK
jgi:hypothetical protein